MGEARILYPLIYSAGFTIATLVILFAQLKRKQQEGTAINYQVIQVLVITTLLAWVGTGLFWSNL